MRFDYVVTNEYDGKRVLSVLKGKMSLSGRLIKQLKLNGGVFLNNKPVRTIDLVHLGDNVSVVLYFDEVTDVVPEDVYLSVIYEDDCFLAIDKPHNTPVHPTTKQNIGTSANAVVAHFMKQNLSIKVRPINRLDKDTSGIVLFAKNPFIQERIIRQMKEDKVYKSYIGIVHGTFEPREGVINLPIARKDNSIIERVIDPSGYESLTRYKTLETYNNLSMVQFILETGRTHQIRVHASAAGHPILGDWLYSNIPTDLIARQALHAHILAFDHPITKERITLTAPIPEDIERVLANPQIL